MLRSSSSSSGALAVCSVGSPLLSVLSAMAPRPAGSVDGAPSVMVMVSVCSLMSSSVAVSVMAPVAVVESSTGMMVSSPAGAEVQSSPLPQPATVKGTLALAVSSAPAMVTVKAAWRSAGESWPSPMAGPSVKVVSALSRARVTTAASLSSISIRCWYPVPL